MPGGLGFYFLFLPQVKQESLGISTKMFLKVDVESGKLYFKKSKDGPEDKYFVHNKSKKSKSQPHFLGLLAMLVTWFYSCGQTASGSVHHFPPD